MEHLTNCHGEWHTLVQFLAAVPFIGIWIRSWLRRPVLSRVVVHSHKDRS